MTDGLSKPEARAAMAERRAVVFAANPLAGLTLSAWAPRAWIRPNLIVSGYWPFRSEIDPRPLMQRFERAGAGLALPGAPAKGSDAPLRFHSWRMGDGMHRGDFGVHEPHPSAEQLEPDIVLVPLLAFDRAGGRLGYGAGHYDRTLEGLRARKTVLAVGLAFAAQELAHLPTEAHDQRLDAVLTERGLIPICAKAC